MSLTRCVLLLLLGLSAAVARAQVAPEPHTLISGQPVEREIAGGESHNYQINLAAGQFVRFLLEQRAIDSTLILIAPDSKQLIEMNLTGAGSDESLSLEVVTAGAYRLTVQGLGAPLRRGNYRLEALVKAAATDQDKKRLRAEALMLEANELAKQGGKTAQQTIERFQQALTIWRELGERPLAANSLFRIGLVYRSISQNQQALESFEQALPIYQQAKNRTAEGSTLYQIGASYAGLSQLEKTVDYLEQALAIAREVRSRESEGVTLGGLAGAYSRLARYERSIEYCELSLPIYRELNDRRNEGLMLTNLGIDYSDLGRYEKALEYLEQALVISRERKDRLREAQALVSIGACYDRLGQLQTAIGYYEQALPLARDVNSRYTEMTAVHNIGVAYLELKQYDKAVEYLEQTLALSREVKDRLLEGSALSSLGDVYVYGNLERYEKGIEYYQQALAISREIKDRAREALTLNGLAYAERALGNLPAARTYIEESLKVSEATRTETSSPESRASFLTGVQNSYQLYTDILMRQHQAEPTKGFDALAVEVSERQRARSLLDILTEARADVRQGVDAALLERERSLGKQLNDKAQLLTQASKPKQADALKKEIGQLETDLERAQVAIRKASPHYAALVQPQPLKLKEIQAQLDADTLLLEYSLGAVGQEHSYVWAITKDSLASYELPKGELIEKDARQVYELLTARSASTRGETAAQRQERISEAEAKLPAAARELSQTILAPFVSQLGNKRLVIVADGALQYIPFAMLPEPGVRDQVSGVGSKAPDTRHPMSGTQPLIVKHEVVSLPSASALAIQRAELAGRQPAPKMLAVIADPVFDRTDPRFKTVATDAGDKAQTQTTTADDARSIEHLAANSGDKSEVKTVRLVIPRLPFTRQEANQLMALAPKGSSFSAIDFQASRATAIDPALSQYRYVHIATHGLLDTERQGLSALVFSMVDAEGKPQNGFLRANDIYNLKLPAELVVLSACQTGLGKEIKGEGLVGLTRGFMYAGAARVVVSLWNVNDKATADLMTKFYEKILKQGERPSAALRAAQVEMWKQKQWQSPYYWAAFTMQGEWR